MRHHILSQTDNFAGTCAIRKICDAGRLLPNKTAPQIPSAVGYTLPYAQRVCWQKRRRAVQPLVYTADEPHTQLRLKYPGRFLRGSRNCSPPPVRQSHKLRGNRRSQLGYNKFETDNFPPHLPHRDTIFYDPVWIFSGCKNHTRGSNS